MDSQYNDENLDVEEWIYFVQRADDFITNFGERLATRSGSGWRKHSEILQSEKPFSTQVTEFTRNLISYVIFWSGYYQIIHNLFIPGLLSYYKKYNGLSDDYVVQILEAIKVSVPSQKDMILDVGCDALLFYGMSAIFSEKPYIPRFKDGKFVIGELFVLLFSVFKYSVFGKRSNTEGHDTHDTIAFDTILVFTSPIISRLILPKFKWFFKASDQVMDQIMLATFSSISELHKYIGNCFLERKLLVESAKSITESECNIPGGTTLEDLHNDNGQYDL
ncbi:hypothetical protein Cyrtocomes_01058 [Candidatus Cyrtobacter comes]|uniref:Uncharacterized protein n=1 Tax=Candidatus Cyrtobacter comes TaxID=675776 RepID=A0ABU5L9E5_9RICK|nr:hypothetical protein [Candidatus Cyrtobacter comes]MDZ5762667.1 hypothetical protein [Candidatus Cyrtobacter comes]